MFCHPQAGALASLRSPNDPLHGNELFVRKKDRGIKHHPSLLPRLDLVSGVQHHAMGITTHGALMLVVKQHLASGQEDLLAIDLIQTQNGNSR